MTDYLERAAQQRMDDFNVVRDWVFGQIDDNLPAFAHEIACMLAGARGPFPADYDYRQADAASVGELRRRLADAVYAQVRTAELAAELEEDDEEAERDAERENAISGTGNPYLDSCHARMRRNQAGVSP